MTTMSPRTPWARPSRPTCSSCGGVIGSVVVVEELDIEFDAVASGGRARHGANAGGCATPTADHPTQIAGADTDLEAIAAIGRGRLDTHRVRVIDDRANNVGEHRRSGVCAHF